MLPRVKCPKCKKEFATQWAEKPEDRQLPAAPVVGERFEVARNFCNKLWNAARFVMMNVVESEPRQSWSGRINNTDLLLEDRWILSRLATVTQQVTDGIANYRFAEIARTLYDFAWDEFCSFYVEMVKYRLSDPQLRPTAERVLVHVLDTLVRLLHPIVPFVTEEIWQRLNEIAPDRGLVSTTPATESVTIAPWPEADMSAINPVIEMRFGRFQEVLRALREVRSRQNVPPKVEMRFVVKCDPGLATLLEPMTPYFRSMAGAVAQGWGPDVAVPALSSNVAISGAEIYVDLAGLIDIETELAKKMKDIQKLEGLIKGKETKLANEAFLSKAPPEVLEKERESLSDLKSQLAAAQEACRVLRGN